VVVIIVGGRRDGNDDNSPMHGSKNTDRVGGILTSGKLLACLFGRSSQNIICATKC
jgi:hypothetical protein